VTVRTPSIRKESRTVSSQLDPDAPDTVVLIHGLFLTARSWERWVERYEGRGYRVIARDWPGMEGDLNELRRDPSALNELGIGDIVDHYAGIVSQLDRPPIIMGHSFGGAFTEILLDRGLGAAGVGIDAGAVKGITKLPLSSLRSAWPVLKNPANRHGTTMLSPEEFHYGFTNTMTEQESAAVYEAYAAPGPGRVLFQGALANFNRHSPLKVDFKNDDRAPLLLIGGGEDHTVPAVVDRSTAKHYRKSAAVTEYKEFPGRSHYTIGQEGWEEVADYALDWAAANARVSSTA
jgi:alpha-beta hydrolase superfamily lysophospholipase